MPMAQTGAGQAGTRSCGTCTFCCRLPEIEAFDKPANAWCQHCVEGKGCSIYEARPELCRDFLCLWMTDVRLGPEWKPGAAKLMAYRQGPQITILVDPDHPGAWRREPIGGQLRQWAADAAASGGYVIVFAGDDVFKVRPEAA